MQTKSYSHATIYDERTLITHSHYATLADSGQRLIGVELYRANGQLIRLIADEFILRQFAEQLRSVDLNGTVGYRRLIFPYPIFPYRLLVSFQELSGTLGVDERFGWNEVAQVNWNGDIGSTYVQWVRPEVVIRLGDMQTLAVESTLSKGASGGGTFAIGQGQILYIGNNWARQRDGTGSYVALNAKGFPITHQGPGLLDSLIRILSANRSSG